jgi:hypothetical protein
VIRIFDQVVADWGIYVWNYDGEPVNQVRVLLYNGMTLVMDYEEFIALSDDGGY